MTDKHVDVFAVVLLLTSSRTPFFVQVLCKSTNLFIL